MAKKSTSIPKKDHFNYKIKPQSENQKIYWNALRDADLSYIACSGPSGAGKTLIPAFYAAEQLELGNYEKIYLTRSIIGIKNQNLGYLSGDLYQKMEPWVGSILQHLDKFLQNSLNYYLDSKQIEYLPLFTARGMDISNAILLCTECQNLDKESLKCLMTRINTKTGSKLILEGDVEQSDLGNKDNDFLNFANKFRGRLNSFNWVQLKDEDIVRSGDIPEILRLFREME